MKRSGSKAFGYCDRSGFRYPISELVEEYVQGKPTGRLVGRDMYDDDHPQNWAGLYQDFDDPHGIEPSRPEQTLDDSRRMYAFDPVGSNLPSIHFELARVKAE